MFLPPANVKKRSNALWGSLGSEVNICLISVFYFVHLLCFKWGSEQKKALKLVQGTVQAILPFRPYEAAGLWLF